MILITWRAILRRPGGHLLALSAFLILLLLFLFENSSSSLELASSGKRSSTTPWELYEANETPRAWDWGFRFGIRSIESFTSCFSTSSSSPEWIDALSPSSSGTLKKTS